MEENTNFIQKHPKIFFGFRVALWSIFAAILPFVFIAFRFNLFKKTSEISLSGWGVIAIIIIAIFILVLIKYIKKIAKIKSGMASQCISGLCKVIIPLVALLVIANLIKNNMDLFIQCLGCVILCEAVAIPINPFPALIKETEEEKTETIIDKVIDKITKKDE